MSTVYERTIEVAAPAVRAWEAFVDDREREAWMGTGRTDDVFEPSEVKLGQVERNRLVSWSQRQAGLDGWHETSARFEEVEGGTRITVVRRGFGDTEDWVHFADSTSHGWDEMLADLALYLETGVRGGRHFPFRSGIGATTLGSSAGLRITHVVPGGFADGAGLRAGDVLIRLGGATILDITDVAVLVREHAPGTELEAEYVHGGELLRGRAALSEWHFGTGEYVGHPGGYPKPKLAKAQECVMEKEATIYEFTLERVFDASPELTFDGMLDPHAQLEWWGGDGEIVRATCDLRVGGTATIEWGPSEATLIRTDQVFREIKRPNRVVYGETVRQTGSPVYECLLTFTLEAVDDRTRLKLNHSGFPTLAERDLHEYGTGIFLDRLSRYLERAKKLRQT